LPCAKRCAQGGFLIAIFPAVHATMMKVAE